MNDYTRGFMLGMATANRDALADLDRMVEVVAKYEELGDDYVIERMRVILSETAERCQEIADRGVVHPKDIQRT